MSGSYFIRLLLGGDPRADQQALRLYQKALHRAQRRLKKNSQSDHYLWISADEVAVELEWLLRGACYRVNCLDAAAYQRLNEAILAWTPTFTDDHRLLPCGLVQNGLIAFLPQLRQKQRLEQICRQYQGHLAKAIQQSDNQYRIQEKQAGVIRMRQVWESRQNLSKQCQHFQDVFHQEQPILAKERDSMTVVFLKAVVTVLTFGIAAACGVWSVKGQKMAEKICQVLQNPRRSA